MKKGHFEAIKKASADFVRQVDAIIPDQQREAETDYLYSDATKRDRQEKRRAAATHVINDGAAEAKRKATIEIDAMRAAFKKYMTTTDPAALQSLQALISAGTELTPAEVEAYAATGDYATLRILEPRSKGRVKAPSLSAFEHDMANIIDHFNMLFAYSGPACELADSVTARPYGQSPRVAGSIVKGKIRGLSSELDEIAARWEIIKEG